MKTNLRVIEDREVGKVCLNNDYGERKRKRNKE